jgi:hypothetical protein
VLGWGVSMSETEVKINSERIDDIPLIVEWLKQIEIAKYIDQKLKKPHGNHQGMSYGQLSVLLRINGCGGTNATWSYVPTSLLYPRLIVKTNASIKLNLPWRN